MDARPYLRSLLEYNAWANAELYKKVAELPPEEVTKKRKTLLESIHVSLNHLLSVDMMWLAHMQRRPHGISELRAVQHEDMDDLWRARQEMDDTLLDYFDGLSDDELQEIVDYELIGGNKGSLSRAMCLTHLATHGSYHRGWVADMFGQAGSMPAIIDIPVYERAVRENNLNPLP
ncbi:MAG: DinB family protein [Alphaproteobacteria bacterium]